MMRIYSKKCTIHNAGHNDSRKKANNQCNLLKFIIIYNTTIWIAAESINGRILFYHCAIIIELIVIIVVVGVVSVMLLDTQSMRRIWEYIKINIIIFSTNCFSLNICSLVSNWFFHSTCHFFSFSLLFSLSLSLSLSFCFYSHFSQILQKWHCYCCWCCRHSFSSMYVCSLSLRTATSNTTILAMPEMVSHRAHTEYSTKRKKPMWTKKKKMFKH